MNTDTALKLYQQDYDSIFLSNVRSGTKFVDDRFPPTEASVGENITDVEWVRLTDLFPDAVLVGPREPVVQGYLGNCWFISAINHLSSETKTARKFMKTVLPKLGKQCPRAKYFSELHATHPGVFKVQFYRHGIWTQVVVDDYVPVVNGNLLYARPYSYYYQTGGQIELWGPIIEKAYAKLRGSYLKLDVGNSSDALLDLTGWIPEYIDLIQEFNPLNRHFQSSLHSSMKDNNSRLSSIKHLLINGMKNKSSFATCSIRSDVEFLTDFEKGHSYSVLKMKKRGGKWYLLLRNPRGRSDSGYHLAADYECDLWVELNVFCMNFTSLILLHPVSYNPFHLGNGYRHCDTRFNRWSIEDGTAGGSINYWQTTFLNNPQYSITVSAKKASVMIVLAQKNPFSVDAKFNRENTSIGFTLLRVAYNRKHRLNLANDLSAIENIIQCKTNHTVAYSDARQVTGSIDLIKGTYVLVPSTIHPNIERDYQLSVYSSERQVEAMPLVSEAKPDTRLSYLQLLNLQLAIPVAQEMRIVLALQFNGNKVLIEEIIKPQTQEIDLTKHSLIVKSKKLFGGKDKYVTVYWKKKVEKLFGPFNKTEKDLGQFLVPVNCVDTLPRSVPIVNGKQRSVLSYRLIK